ncbi:MAG: copper-binding protein [Bryobacteraceae bacterium]|nr:copper-binding protein [Bryobacteraceae bacterium]
MNRRVILSILAALVAVTLLGCIKKSPPPVAEKRYPLTGEVMRLNEKDKVAVIKHDEIVGFMEAMTMGFSIPEPAEWAKLREGMKIKATVVEKGDDYWVSAIEEVKP